MIIFSGNNINNLDGDEEEEEETEGGIDDALLGELDDEVLDDGLLEEIDPLLKVGAIDPLALEEEDPAKEEGVKIFEDDEDEEVDDYDSFDDQDEM